MEKPFCIPACQQAVLQARFKKKDEAEKKKAFTSTLHREDRMISDLYTISQRSLVK